MISSYNLGSKQGGLSIYFLAAIIILRQSALINGFQIQIQRSGMCLDYDGDYDPVSGIRLVQRPCNGSVRQDFQREDKPNGALILKHPMSGLCVDATHPKRGADVVLSTCNGGVNQIMTWMAKGSSLRFHDFTPFLCMTVHQGSVAAGAKMVKQGCHGGSSQHFSFLVQQEQPAFEIKIKQSAMCLDFEGATATSNTTLLQQPCSGSPRQRFARDSTLPDGSFILKHSSSGLCIDAVSASWESDIVISNCHGRENQQITWAAKFSNLRFSDSDPALCMGVYGNSDTAGSKLVKYNCNGRDSQHFSFLDQKKPPGSWSGPYEMPIVAAAAANLADGRVLAWSAFAKYNFEIGGTSGKTYVSIFDPVTNKSSEAVIEDTEHDMFCPGTAVLSDGRIMITGGATSSAVTFYDPQSNKWSKGDAMNIPRGYHSMTVLTDGSVFTLGGSWGNEGGNKHGEEWNVGTGDWELKDNIQLTQGSSLMTDTGRDYYMWMFTAPNSQVFQAGPSKQMHWIDPSGEGQVTNSKFRRGDMGAMTGNAVMYDIGKILTLGGAPRAYSEVVNATARAYTIDINGGVGQEIVKRVGDMTSPRGFSNSVVLPSGEVVVVGGQSTVGVFEDSNAVLSAELWSPITEEFTQLASMTTPRNYHSVAILLKDGRVWAAGGGLCGDCATNHADSETLTPPYLLNADDGTLKPRPRIRWAPKAISPGQTIFVSMNTLGDNSFVLVRLSAVTHATNNDQRRIPLTVVSRGSRSYYYNVLIPDNPSVVLTGNYFLFAVDSDGVPSIARTVVVKRTAD